jgi:predicted nucleic acid-binding Zn ribbon protein
MKRNHAEHIGKLIYQFLRQEGLEAPLYEQRLLDSWSEVLGPTITSYTKELFIRNQTLFVHLTSSVLRQELTMCRTLLVHKLNEHVGSTVIANIVFQ